MNPRTDVYNDSGMWIGRTGADGTVTDSSGIRIGHLSDGEIVVNDSGVRIGGLRPPGHGLPGRHPARA
jgi:hypothetical protein